MSHLPRTRADLPGWADEEPTPMVAGGCFDDDAAMLRPFKDFLDRLLVPGPGAGSRDSEHLLQVATAVMLVEVMRADASFHDGEREAVRAALQQRFSLTADEAASLSSLAQTTAQGASDLFTFTSRINDRFDMPDKLRMIEQMWDVAYADGHLSEHERHVLWRIADLLHVPHGAYVHARLRAQEAAGNGTA